jgi:hypothetical protein
MKRGGARAVPQAVGLEGELQLYSGERVKTYNFGKADVIVVQAGCGRGKTY